jgi:hypothetical protein
MTNSDSLNNDLNKLLIPLPELRALCVALMKEGATTIPLGDLLLMIQDLIRKEK